MLYYFSHLCFAVRLVDGPTNYEGRVEVYHNSTWGAVCDNGWDLNDAQVVCSELDYGNAIAAGHSVFHGESNELIWLDSLNCVGVELTIGNCSHKGWEIESCNHTASVKCSTGNVGLTLYLICLWV